MYVLHVINHKNPNGIGFRHVKRVPEKPGTFTSGYWDISLTEAEKLIGGMLCMHETKAGRSTFGGRVLSVEQQHCPEFPRSERVVFTILVDPTARGAKWRGADHAMAHSGGVIEV